MIKLLLLSTLKQIRIGTNLNTTSIATKQARCVRKLYIYTVLPYNSVSHMYTVIKHVCEHIW